MTTERKRNKDCGEWWVSLFSTNDNTRNSPANFFVFNMAVKLIFLNILKHILSFSLKN